MTKRTKRLERNRGGRGSARNPMRLSLSTVSAWIQITKALPDARSDIPTEGPTEEVAVRYLDSNPAFDYMQRADMSEEFRELHRFEVRVEVPIKIPYFFEGGWHDYYPDILARRRETGRWVLIEAGSSREKTRAEARAKAAAARRYCAERGWEFLYFTEKTVSLIYEHNERCLHSYLVRPKPPAEVIASCRSTWQAARAPISIAAVVDRVTAVLGDTASVEQVAMAAWTAVAEAHQAGALVLDIGLDYLELETPLLIARPSDPEVPFPPLQVEPWQTEDGDDSEPDAEREPALALPSDGPIDGRPLRAVVEPAEIEDEGERSRFVILLDAMKRLESRESIRQVSRSLKGIPGMGRDNLGRLYARWLVYGDPALVKNWTYDGAGTQMEPQFAELVRKLRMGPKRPGPSEIHQDPQMAEIETFLRGIPGIQPKQATRPSVDQISYYLKNVVDKEPAVAIALQGLKHPVRPRYSALTFVRSLRRVGEHAQIDIHVVDALLPVEPGLKLVYRTHLMAMIDVLSAAPLAILLSPVDFTSEDVKLLVRMAATDEKQEWYATHTGSDVPWDCAALVASVTLDGGAQFISYDTVGTLGRLGTDVRFAAAFDPKTKGVVEAWFSSFARPMKAFPGATMGSITRRGAYPAKYLALQAGLTYPEFSSFIYRSAIEKQYAFGYNAFRDGTPRTLYLNAKERYGVASYVGKEDLGRLLLTRARNRKLGGYAFYVHDNGINFQNTWYRPIDGKVAQWKDMPAEVWFDRFDMRAIEAKVGGIFIGTWVTDAHSVRTSLWEAQDLRRGGVIAQLAARALAEGTLADVLKEARLPAGQRTTLANMFLRMRHKDAAYGTDTPAQLAMRAASFQAALQPRVETSSSLIPFPSKSVELDPDNDMVEAADFVDFGEPRQ